MMEKKPEWKELIPAWKKFIRVFCIVIIVMGCVNTCATRGRAPKPVTVYYGSSAYADVEQLVDNGSYEEAVELCMNELEKVQKGSDKEMELNSLYEMRWNPMSPGTHQYATDIAWAKKQTSSIANMYEEFPEAVLTFSKRSIVSA